VAEYWARAPIISANAVTASLPWSTDFGITAEIRLVLKSAPNTGPRHRRDERARAPGELERSVLFNWLHGLAKNTGPYYLGVQARVTSGIGNVDVYQPSYIALVGGESVGATGTGV
jgi:hypothetical protein